ncbi:MAG TPA: hypothetical protein VJ986_00920 [Gaiellaceae bacterium]|nr:hypothetical protein [Gaiellaceae bacterium]
MSAGWVAGSTRARLLLQRRIGAGDARSVARAGDLEDGLARLAGTAYAGAATASPTLEDAQRAVASVLLLELRLLLGWLPRGSSELVRSLGAWFELVNVEDRLAYLRGSPLLPAYELGALASAWPRAAGAASPAELRDALRASVWADPGGDDEAAIHLGLRLAWARRIEARVPEARAWVGGALALVAARGVVTGSRTLRDVRSTALRGLGDEWRHAETLGDLRRSLPPRAGWVLAGAEDVVQPWELEAAWWRRVGSDAEVLARTSREGRAVVIGSVALLALDATRVAAALAAAAVASERAREVVDALL